MFPVRTPCIQNRSAVIRLSIGTVFIPPRVPGVRHRTGSCRQSGPKAVRDSASFVKKRAARRRPLVDYFFVERVDHHSRPQFGFEPRGLRRHDVARVGNVDQLLHRDGVEGERRLHLPAVHTAFQLAQTADAAHEVDPLRGAQILDVQNWSSTRFDSTVTSSTPIGSLSSGARRAVRLYQRPSRYIEKLCSAAGRYSSVPLSSTTNDSLSFFEKFGRRQAVQVLHHAVVVDDAELARREGHGQEIAVLLAARVVRILRAALLSHARRGGRAVVTVGDVERRDARENLRDTVVGLPVADHPQLVPEAVCSREVVPGALFFTTSATMASISASSG